MSGQWKPGDVAMVRRQDGTEVLAMWGGWNWHCSGNGFPLDQDAEPRPVAVIDLDDPKRVEALAEAWDNVRQADFGPQPMTMRAYRMRAALRALLPTPKPSEPTGLGAVVEDTAGVRWLLHTENRSLFNPWQREGKTEWRGWSQINAVKVLSDGVQP